MKRSDGDPLLAAYLARRAELVRYFRARLRSAEAAEELVQDIYLKIADRPAAEEIAHPGAYLYRLGSNLMLDRLKQARRAERREAAYQVLQGGAGETPDEAPPADDAFAARQRLSLIIEAIKDLPAPVQEAFRLHKIEGLSHAETAARMGVSRSSVEKYLMTSLRRIIAKVGPP